VSKVSLIIKKLKLEFEIDCFFVLPRDLGCKLLRGG